MHRTLNSPSRGAFLKAMSAGLGAAVVAPADFVLGEQKAFELSQEHRKAVDWMRDEVRELRDRGRPFEAARTLTQQIEANATRGRTL